MARRMLPYHLHIRLDGFDGAYAQKYSVLIRNAHVLRAILSKLGASSLAQQLAPGADRRGADAYATFQAAMSAMKLANGRFKQTPFYLGIKNAHDEYVSCSPLPDGRVLHCTGEHPTVASGDEHSPASDALLGEVTVSTVWQASHEPLKLIAMICEEGFARAMNLIIDEVGWDAPVPPPLFQL